MKVMKSYSSTVTSVPLGGITLLNSGGETVSTSELKGKSVGLLFCNNSSPQCLSIMPFLIQFYNSINGGSVIKKIEIIYISCDNSQESYERSISRMPWLHMEYNSSMQAVLMHRYNIVREDAKYSGPLSMEVPSIIVIDSHGGDIQRFPLYYGREETNQTLKRWDWRNNVFA